MRGDRLVVVVELEGIEPSSVKRLPALLRPFPCLRLYGRRAAGSVDLAITAGSFSDARGLCLLSVVSPTVHHYFCCRAGVVWPRVPLLVAVTLIPLGLVTKQRERTRHRRFFWCPV